MSSFQKISNNISELTIQSSKTKPGLKWTNIVNANRPEINYLKENYNFNLEHLHASIATVFSQRPMISQEKGYFFIILHFPILVKGRVVAGEIEFFIGHEYLVTVHNNNIPALTDFLEISKNNPDSLASYNIKSSIILLYELLNRLINDCYVLIDDNSIHIAKVEDLIFSQKQKEAVTLILNLRRNIINLRKILQNHEYILKKLTEVKSSLVPQKEIREHYDTLVEHSKRIWAMLDNQKEMVSVLNDTNESLLDGQMTQVMKTLTIISVIVFPLTLLATLFAMRTNHLPFEHNPYGFWIVVGIMAVCALFMLLIFKRRRWL
jgi:magnesium transporter